HQTEPGLLHGILSVGVRTEHPVGDGEEVPSIRVERGCAVVRGALVRGHAGSSPAPDRVSTTVKLRESSPRGSYCAFTAASRRRVAKVCTPSTASAERPSSEFA